MGTPRALTALALGLALFLLRVYAGSDAGVGAPVVAPSVHAPTPAPNPESPTTDAAEERAPLRSLSEPPPAAEPRVERSPRTEREYHERFLARLRGGERAALEAEAPTLLISSGSRAEQVALLRAFEDARSPRCDELHRLALVELPCASNATGDSVPDYVLRRFGERMRRDPRVWTNLFEAVRGVEHRLDPALRGRALALLAERASERDLVLLEAEIGASAPGLARDAGAAAFAARRVRDANESLGILSSMEEEAP